MHTEPANKENPSIDRQVTMNSFFDATRIDPANVSYVFLFGSRIYGTHSSDSDYDVMVVLKPETGMDWMKQFVESYQQGVQQDDNCNGEKPNEWNDFPKVQMEEFMVNSRRQYRRLMIEYRELYNVSVYSYEVFADLVNEHCIWVLFAMFSNMDMEHEHFRESACCYPFNQYENDASAMQLFKLRMPKLRESVLNEVARTWQKAYNRIVKENDLSKGRKLFVYTFRYLNWAIQLADPKHNHTIYDYQVGNDMHRFVMKIAQKQSEYSLEQIHLEYEKLFEGELKLALEEFTQLAQHRPTDGGQYSDAHSFHHLRSFLNSGERGVDDLTTYFSIQVHEVNLSNDDPSYNIDDAQPPTEDNHMRRHYQLFVDSHETKSEHPMVNICNGVVISQTPSDGTFSVVAMGLPVSHEVVVPSFEANVRYCKSKYPIESTIHCFKSYRNSQYYLMFPYDGQWKVVGLNEGRNSGLHEKATADEFWKAWKMCEYCEPVDQRYSYIFEYKRREFSVDLNLYSVTQTKDLDPSVSWRELCRSDIIQLMSDQQLNWQLCATHLTRIVPLPFIDEFSPFSYESLVPDITGTIQALLSELRPHEQQDLLEELLELRSLEFCIEQNNKVYNRRFTYRFPVARNLEHLHWFREDTLMCYYIRADQIPSDVHDAIFDLIRYSLSYVESSKGYRMNPRVLDELHLNTTAKDATNEGNAWYYVQQIIDHICDNMNYTLVHINSVYSLFEQVPLKELEQQMNKRALEVGITNLKKNTYLRQMQAVVCSLKKELMTTDIGSIDRQQHMLPTTTLSIFCRLEMRKAKKMLMQNATIHSSLLR